MLDFICKLFCKDCLTAREVYYHSFGVTDDRKKRLSEVFLDVNQVIRGKSQLGHTNCTINVPADLSASEIDCLISDVSSKGFRVTNLKDVVENVKRDVLFINWEE